MVGFEDIRDRIIDSICDVESHYFTDYELNDGESVNSERLEDLIDEISEEMRDLLNAKIIETYGRRV